METYSDMREVEERYVIPQLGDYAEDYDTEAIAQAVTEFDGAGHLVIRDGVDGPDGSFNRIIEAHTTER